MTKPSKLHPLSIPLPFVYYRTPLMVFPPIHDTSDIGFQDCCVLPHHTFGHRFFRSFPRKCIPKTGALRNYKLVNTSRDLISVNSKVGIEPFRRQTPPVIASSTSHMISSPQFRGLAPTFSLANWSMLQLVTILQCLKDRVFYQG